MSGIFTSVTKFVRGALTSSYQVDVVKEGKPLSVRPANPAPAPAPAPVIKPTTTQNKQKPANGGGIF